MAKTKKMKYKKYDDDGDLILEKGNGFNIVEKADGSRAKKWTRKKKTKRGLHNAKNVINHPKARTGGFDKNPQNIYTGNVGNRLVNEKRKEQAEALENGTFWKINQRECLKRMLKMPQSELYSYMVLWNQLTVEQALSNFGVNVTLDMLTDLDQSEPTMIQLVGITMVQGAIGNPKYSLNILEMIEGKAVSQVQLTEEEKKAVEEKAKNTAREEESELEHTLNALKSQIFAMAPETSDTGYLTDVDIELPSDPQNATQDKLEPSDNELEQSGEEMLKLLLGDD